MPKIAVDGVILKNEYLSDDVKEVVLSVPQIATQALPGQFVHVKIAQTELLRRPISISDVDAKAGTLSLIYRIVGKGTTTLANIKPGEAINCLGPLGNGFDLNCRRPLLVGGGMGIAPLIYLAKQFNLDDASVLLGGKNKREMFWQKRFADLVKRVHITTDDGSVGAKGFTVDVLPRLLKENHYDRIFVCGPHIMMQGVAKIASEHNIPCQVSLEKYMACGIGACLSCTCESTNGGKRKKVCTDGPVFWAEEVL